MTDPRDPHGTGARPGEESVLAALRQVPVSRAPEAVRTGARRAFLAGEVAGGMPPAAAEPRRVAARRPRFLAIALASAALIAIVAGYGASPSDEWRVRELVTPQGVTAGSDHLTPEVGDVMRPGLLTTGPESELELQLGRRLRVRLLAGTQLVLPPPPGRWFGRDRALEVARGEAFGTSAGALGFTLRLTTPEAVATLTGTSFAVIRGAEATCFCLYRGALDIVAGAAGKVVLPVEHRVFIFRDKRPPQVEPIDARERMKLSMIDGAGVPPMPPRR